MMRADIFKQSYDVIVIGGGITGAGVFREAVRSGLRCLLVEQKDFAWGTSSKSGKLVHGGLRYLSQGQVRTTWHSVRERQMMLSRYKELVRPLDFYIPIRRGDVKTSFLLKAGLTVYDLMAFRMQHRKMDHQQFIATVPQIDQEHIGSGFQFQDALTDDVRLVIQVIKEAVSSGGQAVNYASVIDIIKSDSSTITGVRMADEESGNRIDVMSGVVINVTGAWVDDMRSQMGKPPIIRKLRGSHLIVPGDKLILPGAVTIVHPNDERPLYVLPWKGAVLIGTTDLDHAVPLNEEPAVTAVEADYMLSAVNHWFPEANIQKSDVISTMAGIRPVVDTGKSDPSKESRDHVVLSEDGLISVAGGKMTTFRLLAKEALQKALQQTGVRGKSRKDIPLKPDDGCFDDDNIGASEQHYLQVLSRLKTAAQHEWVVHLDDLLIRRTRVGILTRNGGLDQMDRLRSDLKNVLPWDDARWDAEIERYRDIWQKAYSPELMG